MKKVENMEVVSQQQIAASIYKLVLKGELVSEMQQPGQFVHLKVSDAGEPILRRPISICEIDQEAQTFTMLYRSEGAGTTSLSKKMVGERVNVLGPLGKGFPVDAASPVDTVLLIGGGIGVPPLYQLAKELNAKGVQTIHILGFQTKEAVFYEEEFKALGTTYVATADGTHGHKGFVTDVIRDMNIEPTLYYTCGPHAMLRAVEAQLAGCKGFISMEERMGCGIGACFACVCKVQADESGTQYRKICSDGPVFPAGEVVV